MKKTLAIILAILMIVTTIPMAFAAEDLTDDITSVTLKDTDNDGYYEIATADELKAFANLVNAGNTAINVELTSDIVLNENVITEDGQLSDNSESFEVWVPIGNSDVKYTGVFDGARHVISGLYYKGNGEFAGLFGAIDGKYQDKSVGAIRDLYLIDSYFDIESSDRWFRVGGLAGYSYYAHFDNCYVEAQFNLISTYHGSSIYLGGISGMTYSTAENCFSDLAVSITKDKNAPAPWFAGIFGNGSSTAVIINCHTNCDSVSTGNPKITNSTASRTAEEFENGTLCSLVGFHPCESTEGKKATCTEAGWKSEYCTACDYTESHSEIPATGHTLTSVKAKTPTCTEVGYEAYEYCTVCDYTTYKEIPAVNHKDTLIQVVGKDVTCTEVGYAAYEYCTACDYTTYEEIPALGHVFSTSGICDVCGEVCVHESIVEGKCDDCGAEVETVTITMTDSYGDGWNGNAIVIEKLIDGVYTEVASATFEYGDTATYNAFLDKDGNYVFKWIQGSYSNECSFVINVGGEDVYEVTGASRLTDGQEFYRICAHKTFTDGKCDDCDYVCTHETYTDGVCDACGYECPHENWTDGVCDACGYECLHTWAGLYGVCAVCGYECPHESTQKDIFRPAQNKDGTWINGVLIATCDACGHSTVVQEVKRDHEGYKVFDETAAKIEAILNSGVMVENMNEYYTRVLNNMKNIAYEKVYTDYEGAVPSMTEGLNRILAEIEAGLADGTMKKADWTYMTAALEEIKALIDNNPSNIIPSMVGNYYSPNGFYSGSVNNPSYSQAAYDEAEANYGFRDQLETLIAGLKDGTMLKADYTEIDEAIADIDEKLNDADLTDEAKTELEDIKAQLEAMKKNPLSSKADVEELMKAVEELDEAIEDGTVVIAEGSVILEAYDAECGRIMSEKYGEEAINRIVSIMMQNKNEELVELYAYADTITGTIAENADKIEELKRKMDALYAAIERCIIGTHTVEEYAITSSAKCGVNAVETGICYYCVETVTREVENTALTHSFTKYEVTEEAKCGVAGKEQAYCDNGCGEIEVRATEALKHIPLDAVKENEVDPECEKEGSYDLVVYCDLCGGEISRETFAVDALEHIFVDYVYNNDATCTADGTKTAICLYNCGKTDTVTAEDTMLNHADEDGDGICDDCETEIKDVCPDCGGPAHEETGVPQYICMLITLIKLVVSLVKALQAVA